MYYLKMLYYGDRSLAVRHILLWVGLVVQEREASVVWHKINVLSSDVCCVSWEGPVESLVIPLWDLKFHVCKGKACAVLLAATIDFPAMVDGHQGTVEQDEGQWAAVWQGRASLGVTWSALCLEWATASLTALMRNHK